MFPYPFCIIIAVAGLFASSAAQLSKYQPCPLLGPYQPAPVVNVSSDEIQRLNKNFTKALDSYIAKGDGKFGPISPNTTSFSIALFAGSKYIPDGDDPLPFFFDYHHNASDLGQHNEQSPDTVFAIGDLTQLFTTLALLSSEGDAVWSRSITEYLPELVNATSSSDLFDPTQQVSWKDVTLGALASHMAGIARSTTACKIDSPCKRDEFLQHLVSLPPIELPETRPIYSLAAFELLAQAMQSEFNTSFAHILAERIIKPLELDNTSLLSSSSTLFGDGPNGSSINGEPASLGLSSTIKDLSSFGRAILTSQLISPLETRRWLQPVSDTSNLRNGIGLPWQIYHYGEEATDPIIEIYTLPGSVGSFSSYFGIVPAYDVGFAVLAVDSGVDAPDLNAYVDLVLYALQGLIGLGVAQASENLGGMYHGSSTSEADASSTISLQITGSDPGIAVKVLTVNGTDWLSRILQQAGIAEKQYLDMRLYPTNLQQPTNPGMKQVFQAVIEDKSALADAGTPTCVSWQTVGVLELDNQPLDRLTFEFNEDGVAVGIEWPVLGAMYKRVS